jgi:cytochrome P450
VGHVDLVRDLAEPAVTAVVAEYFGMPGDPIPTLRLFQALSQHCFSFWKNDRVRDRAAAASVELRRLALARIAELRASAGGGAVDDTVFGRLVAMPDGFDDDDGVTRTALGLTSGFINAPLGILIYGVDKLVDLDEGTLEPLRRAAREATLGDERAEPIIQDYLLEAERFVVYPPFVHRYAERNTVIAAGTRRETLVPRGATVVAWGALAMFDEEVVSDPWTFRTGRPAEQFLGFGHGRHACIGTHIGQAVLGEVLKGIFAMPRTRRARGESGKVRNLPVEEGRYPVSFELEFDPHV